MSDKSRERQREPSEDVADCWIQWKGTNVCMDFHCTCGCFGHIDADFCYYIKCPDCGQVFATGEYIDLVPLEKDEVPMMEPRIPFVPEFRKPFGGLLLN